MTDPTPVVPLFPLNAYVWDVSRGLRVAVRAGRGRVIEQRPGADGFRYVVAMDSGAWLHGTPEAHLSATSPEDLLLAALDAATAKLAEIEALCSRPHGGSMWPVEILAIIRRQA